MDDVIKDLESLQSRLVTVKKNIELNAFIEAEYQINKIISDIDQILLNLKGE